MLRERGRKEGRGGRRGEGEGGGVRGEMREEDGVRWRVKWMNIMYHSISSSHGGPVQGPSPVHMCSVIVFCAYTHVLLVGRGLKTPVWWQPLHSGAVGYTT